MGLFSNPAITDSKVRELIGMRDMRMENLINKFRFAFLLLISIADVIGLLLMHNTNFVAYAYDIATAVCVTAGCSFIHYKTTRKKYYGWIKFYSTTIDFTITFLVGILMLLYNNPFPVTKKEIVLMFSVFFIFFNALSVLKSDKRIVLLSALLSVLFNSLLYVIFGKFALALVYTNIFIVVLSILNLWVSNHVIEFLIVNSKLNIANKNLTDANTEIRQQKEEITTQRDEIVVKNEILEQQKEEIIAQKEEIVATNDLLLEKNKEITDSINYAKRIQSAMLPASDLLNVDGLKSFVFFKPRDIVSGDFYWTAKVEDNIIITVADCTGHGVPGAFMSMLGISFLKEIVLKEYITSPAIILKRMRKEIIVALGQANIVKAGEQAVRDGMDMALVSINLQASKLYFSGANNPLYIVAPNSYINKNNLPALAENNSVLLEVKGDKMPIAIYDVMDKFSEHEIDLVPGLRFYLFSDGFEDQFGGEKGKKYLAKNLKKLLLSGAETEFSNQEFLLQNAFDQWTNCSGNSYSQVDDVTVLGFEISE